MKRILIYLIAMLLVFPASAQKLFSELVNKYVDVDGFSAVQLTNDMFELYLKKKNIKADDPVYDVLKDLDNMTVITQTYTDENKKTKDDMETEIRKYYKDNGYSLFKTEKTADNDLKIYIAKSNDGIKSMGLLSSNNFALNLIEMNGKIDLTKVASLDHALNIRGLEKLHVFDSNSAPDNFVFNYSYSLPDVYQLNAENREKMEDQIRKAQEDMKAHQQDLLLRQKEMAARQKELFEKYKRFPVIISGPDAEDADYYVNGKKVTKDEIREINPENIESIQVIKQDEGKHKNSQIKIQLKKSN